jgi:hypothetical protein
MIVTVKTSKAGMSNAYFESIKFGLDFEKHADDTFDLIVHDDKMLEYVLKSCNGTVLAKQDVVGMYPYGGE